MTKEIAQYCMKACSQYHNEMCEECPIYGQTGDDHCFEDALQYVINYFEVLDKIRAEIDEIPLSEPIVSADGLYFYGSKSITMGHFREKVLEIIDKYRNEVANETDN